MLHRHAGAHPRAGPARRGLCHRLRVRAPEQAVRRRRRRAAVRGAAARRHRLGALVCRPTCPTGWPPWPCSPRHAAYRRRQRTALPRRAARPDIADDDTGATHRLRIAYIWSSEEAASVADARQRALATAEDALTRIRNGLGGRYYKTKKQVDDRVAQISSDPHRRPDHRHHRHRRPGKPTIAWHRNPDALTAAARLDGLYALATNLPDPPARTLTALDVLDSTKTSGSSNNATATSNKPCTCGRSSCTTTTASTPSSPSSASPCSIYGLIEADLRAALGPDTPLPGILPEHRDAVPTARAVLTAFTDLHATYTSGGIRPRPAHPPSNDSSSPTSTSPYHGPNSNNQHSPTAENGTSAHGRRPGRCGPGQRRRRGEGSRRSPGRGRRGTDDAASVGGSPRDGHQRRLVADSPRGGIAPPRGRWLAEQQLPSSSASRSIRRCARSRSSTPTTPTGSMATVMVRATPTARPRSGLRPRLVVDVSCGDVDLMVLGALDSRGTRVGPPGHVAAVYCGHSANDRGSRWSQTFVTRVVWAGL